MMRLIVLAMLAAGAAQAQPSVERPAQPQPRLGAPLGNDSVERPIPPRIPGGVLRPPGNVDPGIQLPTPQPRANTPVIPPPGTPGGAPSPRPR